MVRSNWRARWLAIATLVSALGATACDKDKEDGDSRDWRPIMAQIDVELVKGVMAADGWSLEGEPMETTMTAEDVRSMGGQADGDTHLMSFSFQKDGRSASVAFTAYPGDVKPATGDRGISMEQALLAAGPRSVGVSVYDAEYTFQKDASVALLDAFIEAAEKKAK